MTRFQKIAALALTSLSIAIASAPSAEARGWRHHRGGLIAAGLLGGAVLGAAFARPAYGYGHGYGYATPVGYGEGCYVKRVGFTWDGRPIRRTICY